MWRGRVCGSVWRGSRGYRWRTRCRSPGPSPSLREQREDVPEWLEQAVLKALAKAPTDRFATATQFAQALAWPSSSSPPPGTPGGASAPKSIAVLPFVNMSADPENEYFTD